MKVGDGVIPVSPIGNTVVPAKVLQIDDLGHGEGFERVQIRLPLSGLKRCYAMNELLVVDERDLPPALREMGV